MFAVVVMTYQHFRISFILVHLSTVTSEYLSVLMTEMVYKDSSDRSYFILYMYAQTLVRDCHESQHATS